MSSDVVDDRHHVLRGDRDLRFGRLPCGHHVVLARAARCESADVVVVEDPSLSPIFSRAELSMDMPPVR